MTAQSFNSIQLCLCCLWQKQNCTVVPHLKYQLPDCMCVCHLNPKTNTYHSSLGTSQWNVTNTTTTTIVLQPFVRDYPGEPVPEQTVNHPSSWSLDDDQDGGWVNVSNLYQLLPSTTIHSVLPVETMCLAIFLHNLCPRPLWSTYWHRALHLIFHTILHPISVFFSQHMPIPSQPAWL